MAIYHKITQTVSRNLEDAFLEKLREVFSPDTNTQEFLNIIASFRNNQNIREEIESIVSWASEEYGVLVRVENIRTDTDFSFDWVFMHEDRNTLSSFLNVFANRITPPGASHTLTSSTTTVDVWGTEKL